VNDIGRRGRTEVGNVKLKLKQETQTEISEISAAKEEWPDTDEL
jgi:hypothetical protein